MSAEKRNRRIRLHAAVMQRCGSICEARLDDGRRCDDIAKDAHHIVARTVAPDGGYELSNLIGLCDSHHVDAEAGRWSQQQLREWIAS